MRYLTFLLTISILISAFIPANAGTGIVPIVELNNNKDAYKQNIITIKGNVLEVLDEGKITVSDDTGHITISEYKKDVLLGCEAGDDASINIKYDTMHKEFRATFFTTYTEIGEVSINEILNNRSKYNGDIIKTKGILSEKKSDTVYTFESTAPKTRSNLQSMFSIFKYKDKNPIIITADWRPELPDFDIGDTIQINGIYYIDPSNMGVNWIYVYSASKIEKPSQKPVEIPGFSGLLTAVAILLWSRTRS